MKKVIIFMLIVSLCSCAQTEENGLPKAPDQSFIHDCEVDSDCSLVQAGCCDCTDGGRKIAINKIYASQWIKDLNTKCLQYDCIPVEPIHASCTSKTSCIKGTCSMIT